MQRGTSISGRFAASLKIVGTCGSRLRPSPRTKTVSGALIQALRNRLDLLDDPPTSQRSKPMAKMPETYQARHAVQAFRQKRPGKPPDIIEAAENSKYGRQEDSAAVVEAAIRRRIMDGCVVGGGQPRKFPNDLAESAP